MHATQYVVAYRCTCTSTAVYTRVIGRAQEPNPIPKENPK